MGIRVRYHITHILLFIIYFAIWFLLFLHLFIFRNVFMYCQRNCWENSTTDIFFVSNLAFSNANAYQMWKGGFSGELFITHFSPWFIPAGVYGTKVTLSNGKISPGGGKSVRAEDEEWYLAWYDTHAQKSEWWNLWSEENHFFVISVFRIFHTILQDTHWEKILDTWTISPMTGVGFWLKIFTCTHKFFPLNFTIARISCQTVFRQ